MPADPDALALDPRPEPLDPDRILAALDPEQREVATALDGPVCVLAGAGTGKTRAVTHRIAYGVHAGVLTPQRVLAVTFTARAAGEMRTRLRGLGVPGVQARTFHSAALRQLQYFWPRVVGGELPRIAEHKAGLVAAAGGRLRLSLERAAVRDLAAEIEWVKVTQTHREEYAAAAARAGRTPPAGLDAATVTRLLSAYEEVKRERGLIDFEDVLVYAVGLLADRADVAAQVRAQYASFVVDEYQDVSPLQQQLLDLWLGDRRDLCVVGDASQTIYSFTGATPSYLLGFRRRFPEAREIRLIRDYRSTPQVVHLANGVLAKASGTAARARLELVAQRPPGPEPVFSEYADEQAEAEQVAAKIAALVAGGVRPSEIAVLFRTNGQSEAFESALADAGITYLVRGGERFFARREVREAVLLLRGAARSGEPGELVNDVQAVLATAGWTPEPPAGGSGAVRERWESMSALVGLASDLAAARPGASLRDLVEDLDERAAAQHAPTVEGVTLASLHAAKGLEWDAVFLVGLTEGMLPITYADTADAVEEERRLLYVGITRAREHLHLSWALARSPGGRASRTPSRFLDGLRPAGRSRADAPAGEGSSRRSRKRSEAVLCRTCGKALRTPAERKLGRCEDCPSTYDEGLLDELRTWRSEQARSASVPAYVVFTDATLTAIAERCPTSVPQLAQISGVGPAKLDKYGQDVLDICARKQSVG